jgi:hypothetical protein
MLLRRGWAEDHDRAMSLLSEALGTASELGMKSLAGKVEALQWNYGLVNVCPTGQLQEE